MENYVINLFGGPGISKSTTAAGLFNILKNKKVETELVTEFAKDATYEQRYNTLDNQFYVTAKQHHRLWRILNYWDEKQVKSGFIVTDSPFILGLVYLKENNISDKFKDFIISEFSNFNNINILLERKKDYNPVGRNQSEQEAREIDTKIENMLIDNNIDYIKISGDENAPNTIFEYLKNARLIKG